MSSDPAIYEGFALAIFHTKLFKHIADYTKMTTLDISGPESKTNEYFLGKKWTIASFSCILYHTDHILERSVLVDNHYM